LCGIEVAEYDSLPAASQVALQFARAEANALGATVYATKWCDVLRVIPGSDVEVVATYGHEYYAGQAAITRHAMGKGNVVTLGTFGDAALYEALMPWLCTLARVEPVLAAPPGVEVTTRRNGGKCFTFVLNHTDTAHDVTLHGVDLITGKQLDGLVTLAPKEVVILDM
jgi:beta-galactosidase